MNTNNKNDELNDILKEANEQIRPSDSWEDLRSRIDQKIENRNTSSGLAARLNENISFWRWTALAAAACLVITSALLFYVVLNNNRNTFSENLNLLSQNQLEHLSEAFSQVQRLFNQNCPWIMINSSGKGEIGGESQDIDAANAKNIVILRLAVNIPGNQAVPQYFDVVTFDNQLVSFNMPVTEKSNMNVALRPVITENNRIQVEISTQLNSNSKITKTVTIADNSFKTLTRVKSGGNWININATGQSLSNI
jgi:hypothetical protein